MAQSLVCRDVPLPGTGFSCVCPVGTGWYGSGCDACVKIVAGNTNIMETVQPYVDDIPATLARVGHPMDVSVDSVGNIYIGGEIIAHRVHVHQFAAAL